ncbi:MAG: Uma2 family endonuclease, partial [Cyanobacteria bacterium P01_F01_bin.86]
AKETERQAKETERQAKETERQAKETERQAKEAMQQIAEAERQAKEAAQAQILQSARNLLATGMSLEQVTDLLNLTAEQVALLKP